MLMRSGNPWKAAMRNLRRPLAQVVVLRHGSTARNRGGVGRDQVRGHADVPMTEAGENEVRRTAELIVERMPQVSVIHTSDMGRAVRSAEILQAEEVYFRNRGAPTIVSTSQLRSWDMGAAMEGRVTTPEVVEQIREWVREDTVVPAGGESFRAFVGRVLGYVGPLFDAAQAEGLVLAIVGHGRTTQVIDLWVGAGCDEVCMRRDFAEMLAEEPDTVPPGGAIRYRWDGLGWDGSVIPTGAPSDGMLAARGEMVRKPDGVIVS